jgi:hypothetical protein
MTAETPTPLTITIKSAFLDRDPKPRPENKTLPPSVDALFYLDIDQTMAGNDLVLFFAGKYLEAFKDKKLVIPEDQWDKIKKHEYAKVFDIPAIAEFRAANSDEFERVRLEMRLQVEDLDRIPNSLKGIWRLTAAAGTECGYYTVRPTVDAQNNAVDMLGMTQKWLGREELGKNTPPETHTASYPKHEAVVICESPKDKLLKILADTSDKQKNTFGWPKVLIDDGIKDLSAAAKQIYEEHEELRPALESLVLVGFRMNPDQQSKAEAVLQGTGVQLLSLPSWETKDVDALLTTLQSLAQKPSVAQ